MAPALSEKIHEDFERLYREKLQAYELCRSVLIEDLENVLTARNLKHIPIHARVKSWERASETAKRRHQDRSKKIGARRSEQEDRSKMAQIWNKIDKEAQEKYYMRWEFDREMTEVFKTGANVFDAMHDLLGARIALYFPDGVEKVDEALRTAGYSVLKILPKGGMEDLNRLRKFVDKRDELITSGTRVNQKRAFRPAFSGYGALHLLINLPRRLKRRIAMPETEWMELKAEIQVGTVIMHAWAEVEHDIIYKSFGSEPPSDGLKRVSDLINGIAITGELALRQLQATYEEDHPSDISQDEK